MKRILAFVILLTLPLGFLIGAHKAVGGLQDDVTVTPTHVYGDPERVAGVSFRTLTTCGNHMWWYTDHTPGDPGVTETEFHLCIAEPSICRTATRGWPTRRFCDRICLCDGRRGA